MSKTLKSLSVVVDLRSAIASKLGADVANIPEANVPDLAKSLGLAPMASVVEYTTKAGKAGAYLTADDVVPSGRFGGGGKVFHRLGDVDAEVTSETIATMRRVAEGFADRSVAIHAIADEADADE